MAAKMKRRPMKGRRNSVSSKLTKAKNTPDNNTPKRLTKAIAQQRMDADLKRSGLTRADGRKAGYKLLPPEKVNQLTGNYAWAYLITYHDADGKKTDNWRVRYLEPVLGAFGAMPKKELRYSQAKATLPRFYFPKFVKWLKFNEDTSEPLTITEGEKKSDKAALVGIPCYSVGGVWAWRSKKHGIPAIPDFKAIKWKGRDVWLCFDNDVTTNPLVIGALNALAHELTSRGAHVFLKHLPKGPPKIGLDDYLVKHSVKQFIKLPMTEYKESEQLWLLNERLAYIESINAVFDFKTRKMYGTSQKLHFAFANRTYQVTNANGKGFTEKHADEEWLKWPNRRQYDGIGYFPGADTIVDGQINTWTGNGVEPKKGSIKPFVDLVDFIFASEPELLPWFWQWLAYPLQHPGVKIPCAVLLHSAMQGVGKSFLGYIIGKLYGDNFAEVGQEQLHSPFNGWAVSKQFILGEEITGTNSRRAADQLKNMITREEIQVNVKYEPQYTLRDCANFLFTSNHVDAMHLDKDDRRYAVVEIIGAAKPDAFYRRISDWRMKGGAAHLLYHLLHDVDTSEFNPNARPPMTRAKQAMIDVSKSEVDLICERLRENPDEILRMGKVSVDCEIFELHRITAFANANASSMRHSPVAMSKALRRAGFNARPVKTCRGTKKLWPIKNLAAWLKLEPHEWAAHYDEHSRGPKFK